MEDEYDLIVLGAGAAGMTAALVAAIEGLRPLVVEKTAQVGGTSARSSGTLWIPTDARAANQYLDALVGDKADPRLRRAFLEAGPAMIECLRRHAGFEFRPYAHHPDYRQELPGAALGNRPLEPPSFDGRELGERFALVASPIPELMLFGGMMVTRPEAARLLRAHRSPPAAWLGTRLLARYLVDRLRHPRGTRLVLGNALVARLYFNLLQREVPISLSTRTDRLLVENGRVGGVEIRERGQRRAVRARRGVVLAGGGFPASGEMRERHLPRPVAQHTPASESCVGETIRLGLEAGGVLGNAAGDNALWFPSSVALRRDGTTAVYPHIVLDRAKPGLIAVNASGRRFTDEAASYHEFTRAMYRTSSVPAWLVCDRRFLWRYGLGMVRPMTVFLKPFLANGYLKASETVEGLARSLQIEAAGLVETVRRHNAFARNGVDEDFGKGGNAYDLANGDPEHRPNPCLGAIATAPFYAVRVEPTPLGTSLGLVTSEHGEVLGADSRALGGLYAVGNDMHAVMGGEYPGAGAQLGPGMTFGYLAARHAARAAR